MTVEIDSIFFARGSGVLFSAAEFHSSLVSPQYDVAMNYQRFLMLCLAGDLNSGRLLLVQNFFEELKERLPN